MNRQPGGEGGGVNLLRIADWLESWAERLRSRHWARWRRKHPAGWPTPVSAAVTFIPDSWAEPPTFAPADFKDVNIRESVGGIGVQDKEAV